MENSIDWLERIHVSEWVLGLAPFLRLAAVTCL